MSVEHTENARQIADDAGIIHAAMLAIYGELTTAFEDNPGLKRAYNLVLERVQSIHESAAFLRMPGLKVDSSRTDPQRTRKK